MNLSNVVALRERNLADVLRDLREARDDYEVATADLANATRGMPERYYADLQDRASEAEDRICELIFEWHAMFAAATGLTFKQVMAAIEEAVL